MIVNNIDPPGVAVSTSPPAEVQDAQACASTAEFVSEDKHVLRGWAEPVQRRDDEGVAIDQRVVRWGEVFRIRT
jgi:hypothetical protein